MEIQRPATENTSTHATDVSGMYEYNPAELVHLL